jgi:threonine dehydrogenase-like Zn-dependent dehydrogenase
MTRLRMERLLRVLDSDRVDPTRMTTHTFSFDEMPRAFAVSDQKLDNSMKVLVAF